jgi:hypothetical protein
LRDIDASVLELEAEIADLEHQLALKRAEKETKVEEKASINETIMNIRKKWSAELEVIASTEAVVAEERKGVECKNLHLLLY